MTTQQSEPAIFELVGIHNRITLENVYHNGMHALRHIRLRNLCEKFVTVKMRSNLRHQIVFQLHNENFPIVDNNSAEEEDFVTNTVAAAVVSRSNKTQEDFSNSHFNQLFNYVNHIDQVELEPYQTKHIVLGLLPNAMANRAGPGHTEESDSDTVAEEKDSMEDETALKGENRFQTRYDPGKEEDTYNTFEVNGMLFFFGYMHERSYVKDVAARSDIPVANSQSQPADNNLAGAEPDYQLSVKFRSTVCQSVLWTDISEVGLNFDDCVVGGTYFKDFTISNKSEIDLFWLLNTVDLTNTNKNDCLRFTDYDTGEVLDNKPIPSYSHRRVRVTFKPKEVGEFNYDLQVENVNDSRNLEQTRIHASVRSVLKDETLVISSGNVVDFGDCCAGAWTTQQLVLKNVSELPLEVHLASDGAEMYFDIKSGLEASKDISIDRKRLLAPRLLRDQYSGTSTTNPTVTPVASVSEMSGANSEVSSRASSPTMTHAKAKEAETSSTPISIDSLGPSIQSSLRSPRPSNFRVPSSSASFNDDSDTDAEGNRAMKTSESTDDSSIASTGNAALENYTRVEDIVIRAGTERRIQVSYRPEKDNSPNDFNAGQLIRRNFRIVLEYGPYRSGASKERKVVQCKARSCTSFVEAMPREINFGDTDVGTLKSLPVNIFNRSDIPAQVELQFLSKVLNCQRGEITIPPRSLYELKLDMYPRKVNAEYRKQLTLVNYLNRDNDQIIEVRSTNIDKNRVTFHSLFYRILTATGANFIDFGSIALNSPALRTFTIDNISNHVLKLEVTTSLPDDFVIYTRKKAKKVDVESDIEKENVRKIDSEQMQGLGLHNDLPLPQSSEPCEPRKQSPSITSKISSVPSGVAKSYTSNQAAVSIVRQVRSNIANRKDVLHSDTAYLDLAVPSSQGNMRKRRYNLQAVTNKATSTSTAEKTKDSRDKDSSRKLVNRTTVLAASSSAPSERDQSVSQVPRRPALALSREDSKSASTRSLGITAARHKSRKNLDWSDITGKPRVPFDDLIAVLEHCSKALPPLFPKQSVEEKFVRHQMAWRHELERLIEKDIIVATKQIEIEAGGEEEVIIVFTPNGSTKPHIQNTPRKQDARIFLRLLEFDRSIEQTQFEYLRDLDHSQIPVRELIVRSHLCRSLMDLGQKNINFGLLERNERRTKSIILHNRSETSLLYTIRKSGSIASGDIMLGSGRHGVVRAFGKREIDFVFEPTLPGQFMERLVVENIRDRDNDQVVLVKANVRKPSTFFIKSLQMTFGVCFLSQLCSRVETIVITNTNKQSRTFEIRTDPKEMQFDFCTVEFDYVIEEDNEGTLTKEQEEEIETLEQKLKIARRKGHDDKVKKYLKKLAKLKKTTFEIESDLHGEPESEHTTPNDDNSQATASTPQTDVRSVSMSKDVSAKSRSDTLSSISTQVSQKYKRTANSVVFPLDAHATKTISVYLKAVSNTPTSGHVTPDDSSRMAVPFLDQITGRIFVHEHKNTDICKKILFTAQVCRDQARYISTLSAELGAVETVPIDQSVNLAEHSINGVEYPLEESQPYLQPEQEMESEPEVEGLTLERSFLDCGRLELDQPTSFYLNVANRSQKGLYFEVIIDSDEQEFFNEFEDVKQLLQPDEQRKVIFPIMPRKIGLQQHNILLRNIATGVTFPFTMQCLVHRSQYLQFPSLGIEGELDLGYSYVDPGCKYSQVTPLLVENITDDDLYISCQSNLSQQVLIFQDEKSERGQVERMFFKRKSMTTVWVAVQPNLLSGYLNTSGDECRELVGGIKFGIYMKEDSFEPVKDEGEDGEYCLALQQTVKFTSLIGQSNLEVSDKIINLGYTDILGGEFYGHFTIKNKSGRLPLDYEVECSSSNIVVDRPGGTLDGWRMSELKAKAFTDANARKPSYDAAWSVSSTQITFKIYSTIYGLLKEKITVTNKYNSMEVFDIEVRLFVDCGTLKIPSTDAGVNWPSNISEMSETSDRNYHKDTHQLPVIKWEDIYVRPIKEETEDADEQIERPPKYVPTHDPSSGDMRQFPSFEVENSSEALMHLIPLSDLHLRTEWSLTNTGAVDELDLGMSFHPCGPALRLSHSQVSSITVYQPSSDALPEPELKQLGLGERGSTRGLLLFYDGITKTVVKAFDLEASFCVSVADLNIKSINIGKIGHATSWKPIPFSFAVRNLSDIMLRYSIEAPPNVTLVPTIVSREQSATEYDLAPLGQCRIEGILDPKACDDQAPGRHEIPIKLINKNNIDNVMELTLRAQMTIFELRFERLNDNSILLPVLFHPLASQNVPCDNWFTICNTTDDDTKFEIGAEIAPDLKSLIKLDVLSRYSNTPLKGGFTLNPRGKIEIRVRAYPIENARLPTDRPDLLDSNGIEFAKVWVSTRLNDPKDDDGRQFSEQIIVRGVLSEVPMFSLSERRLDFKIVTSYPEGEDSDEETQAATVQTLPPPSVVPELAQLSVNNLSQKQALRFKVTLEGPVEFSARKVIRIAQLDRSGIGIVEPGATFPLSVEIIDPKGSLSGQFRIHVDDMDSVHGCRQTTTIYVIEDRRKIRKRSVKKKKAVASKVTDGAHGSLATLKPGFQRTDTPSLLPYINLRGCKRIDEGSLGGRYELDLGQQDMGSTAITKKITLENTSDVAVSYRIRCVPDPEKDWLKISRSEGTLESLSDSVSYSEPQVVTLSFSTAIRNIYLTYLIIENIDNPVDTKTIRVTMEVVARQNVRRGQLGESENSNVFDVFVNGIDTSQTCIDMLNLFYGSEYTARSMLIYNRESVPLEFTIMSNLLHDDPTEILFSTSQSATRLFKSLTVEPRNHIRVYIRFRPLPSKAVHEEINAHGGRCTDLVEHKTVEIYINCRLVKDYQRTVLLQAECRMPAFRVQHNETQALMGTLQKRNADDTETEATWELNFTSPDHYMTIWNLQSDPMSYQIVNDTSYFLLEFPDGKNRPIPPGHSQKVQIKPNVKRLLDNAEAIHREKYLQEYVTVYNKDRPQENYWIPMRMSFGHVSNFQLASGYRSSHAYSMLESHVVSFLNDFNGGMRYLSAIGEDGDRRADLEFKYYYIVDQLVYYSTVKTGENFFQLASLLFCSLLNHDIFKPFSPSMLIANDDLPEQRVWPEALRTWVFSLHYYLSFFPQRPAMLSTLRKLYSNLVTDGHQS